MSLAAFTKNVKTEPCQVCGATVVHREIAVASGPGKGKRFFTPDAHDAPCGLPCMNGGVSGEALKKKRFHGSSRFPCPSCPC